MDISLMFLMYMSGILCLAAILGMFLGGKSVSKTDGKSHMRHMNDLHRACSCGCNKRVADIVDYAQHNVDRREPTPKSEDKQPI